MSPIILLPFTLLTFAGLSIGLVSLLAAFGTTDLDVASLAGGVALVLVSLLVGFVAVLDGGERSQSPHKGE